MQIVSKPRKEANQIQWDLHSDRVSFEITRVHFEDGCSLTGYLRPPFQLGAKRGRRLNL